MTAADKAKLLALAVSWEVAASIEAPEGMESPEWDKAMLLAAADLRAILSGMETSDG